jgi:putative ABC transport system permease protein
MLINFLLVAYRRMLLSPIYSSVNILGLSIGLTSFLLAMLYINDELSYDRFWENADNIYQINTVIKSTGNGRVIEYDDTFPQVAPLLKSGRLVKEAVRMQTLEFLANVEENRYYEDISFVDPDFVLFFDITFVEGNAQEALATPFSLILTKADALKYFGEQSALNRYIMLDGKHNMRVSGVIESLPANTSLEVGLISSIDSLPFMYDENMLRQWRVPSVSTYILLDEHQDAEELSAALANLLKEHSPASLTQQVKLAPIALDTVHVSQNELGGFNILIVLSSISLLILIISCINMINMTTAKSTERVKEVAIRKALGSSRGELFAQVMVESFLMVFVAILVALLLAQLILPWFNQVTYKSLSIDYLDVGLMGQLLLLNLFTALVSGFYPAMVVSAYRPVDVFKGNIHFGQGSLNLRAILVGFQYMIAIGMGIGCYNLLLQLNHIENVDQGFSAEEVIVISNLNWTDIKPLYSLIQTEMLAHPNIESAAGSSSVPGKETKRVGLFHLEGAGLAGEAVSLNHLAVDYSFFDTYRVRLLAGRLFSKDYAEDLIGNPQERQVKESQVKSTYNVIVNRMAVQNLGITDTDTALGKKLISSDGRWAFDIRIVGVVDDLHLNAGQGELAPYIFLVAPQHSQYLSLRINGDQRAETLAFIEQTWSRIVPQYPIAWRFLQDDLNALYLGWRKNAHLMVSMSILAALIASIGAIGLSAFSLRVKTKEIGLRVVLGATTGDLLRLFLWNLSKPLLAAYLMACPVTYYLLRHWLNNFAYRIDIAPLNFILVGAISLLTIWLLIGFYIIRVMNLNPTQTLRHL